MNCTVSVYYPAEGSHVRDQIESVPIGFIQDNDLDRVAVFYDLFKGIIAVDPEVEMASQVVPKLDQISVKIAVGCHCFLLQR